MLAWANGCFVIVLEDELVAGLWLHDKQVGRSTKVEQPNLISGGDGARADRDVASGHLCHSDPNEGDQVNGGVRVVWLDDVHCAGGNDAEPGLGTNEGAVGVTWHKVGIPERCPIIGKNGIVSTLQYLSRHDVAVYRAVPAVIVCRAKERLIDGSANELFSILSDCTLGVISAKNVVERVVLVLEPERVVELDIPDGAQNGGLACVVKVGDGALDYRARFSRVFELPGEEGIPTIVTLWWRHVELEGVIEGRSSEARCQGGHTRLTPPLIRSERLARRWHFKESAPGIQQIPERAIEGRLNEQAVSSGGVAD